MNDPLKLRCTIHSEVTTSLFEHLHSIENPRIRASVLVQLAQQGLLASSVLIERRLDGPVATTLPPQSATDPSSQILDGSLAHRAWAKPTQSRVDGSHT